MGPTDTGRATTTRQTRRSERLTDKQVAAAKPSEQPYKLADGNGLHLLITPAGSKLWRWKYRFAGKEKLMSFGAYPVVSVAQARADRDDARALLLRGTDPMHERKRAEQARRTAAVNSFESVAREWWAGWKVGKSERHAVQVMARLEADVFPVVGYRPVSEVEAPELVQMMRAISARGVVDLASRALQMTNQVFRYAVAHRYAARNPAADIRSSDVLPARRTQNMARLDGRELPELLRRIDAYQGTPVTRYAMKLMALTFTRTGELIGAGWDEIDFDAAQWRIPAERMKMKRPHIVPLSRQAVEVLKTLKLITGHRALLFPGERDARKPMSNNTILKALERMGYKGRMTGHGFRGIASTLLHEMGFDHQHIELQLAHQQQNRVSAAYNHALYLEARTQMMQSWADCLDGCVSGNVVVGKFRRAA
jgi:integrase